MPFCPQRPSSTRLVAAKRGRAGSVVPERALAGVQLGGGCAPKAPRPCTKQRVPTPPTFGKRLSQRPDVVTVFVPTRPVPPGALRLGSTEACRLRIWTFHRLANIRDAHSGHMLEAPSAGCIRGTRRVALRERVRGSGLGRALQAQTRHTLRPALHPERSMSGEPWDLAPPTQVVSVVSLCAYVCICAHPVGIAYKCWQEF